MCLQSALQLSGWWVPTPLCRFDATLEQTDIKPWMSFGIKSSKGHRNDQRYLQRWAKRPRWKRVHSSGQLRHGGPSLQEVERMPREDQNPLPGATDRTRDTLRVRVRGKDVQTLPQHEGPTMRLEIQAVGNPVFPRFIIANDQGEVYDGPPGTPTARKR